MEGDEALLTRIPGVGRKMAQRMILDSPPCRLGLPVDYADYA